MLKRLNPLTVLAAALIWIVATTLVFSVAFQSGALILFAALILVLGRISPARLLLLMIPFALFGFGFFTTNVLFRQENAEAVAVFSQSLAESDAARGGLILFLRALAGGMISLFFALSIEPVALVRALMAYLRLPPRIAYALFAAVEVVPDLAATAHQIRLVEAMRAGRPLRRFPTPGELFRMVVPLMAFAVRRAGRTAIAMEARGFRADRPRTLLRVPGFSRLDLIFALALVAVLGLGLIFA
ncbi:energy-coupling factor transporter transmembrane component T family protein [Consotaella salsifontis]|uniref:Energy-coupling factor transport system permease protein n=1 Tax=Consotaella salsifontis TaxID=1365950 RepID=A0A1T4QG07_9HYPH|nr:energy-coupling factor transporter transmembrane component T [Consotaella salsifontis]SKA02576.1 energy-coupling factor transport system permease protein [Consotaella salsifontis]